MYISFLSAAKSSTPTSALGQFSPYPQLSVHSHVPSEAEDSSWEEAGGRRQRSQYCHSSQDIRSASRSGNHMEAVFEEQQAEVHQIFPPLSASSSPGSMTPTGAMSSPCAEEREKSTGQEVLTSSSQGTREIQGPSPLGLGSRHNPSLVPSTPISNSRDQLSPGPTHHDATRDTADLRKPLNQRYTSVSEISSDRTPTPSKHRFEDGKYLLYDSVGFSSIDIFKRHGSLYKCYFNELANSV